MKFKEIKKTDFTGGTRVRFANIWRKQGFSGPKGGKIRGLLRPLFAGIEKTSILEKRQNSVKKGKNRLYFGTKKGSFYREDKGFYVFLGRKCNNL
jgi:hypothetical protein